MENLKKNLHYIVFAAGIVIGGVLLFVGITIRGGKEEEIGNRVTRLKGQTSGPTAKDLSEIEDRRTAFDRALKDALEELTEGKGVALRRSLGQATDAQRFKSESDQFVDLYRGRFSALAKPAPLPQRMRNWVYRRIEGTSRADQNPWTRMTTEVFANQDARRVAEFRKRQRILHEVCVACETLVASGRFGQQGVELRDFRFEDETNSGANPASSPWREIPFILRLECSPEFALALTAELTRQTALTAGSQQDAAFGRHGFPIRLEGVQMVHVPRPLALRYEISNAMKENEGIDSGLDPTTEAGREAARLKAEQLDGELRPVLPMEVALRMRAQSANPAWPAIAEEPQQ